MLKAVLRLIEAEATLAELCKQCPREKFETQNYYVALQISKKQDVAWWYLSEFYLSEIIILTYFENIVCQHVPWPC